MEFEEEDHNHSHGHHVTTILKVTLAVAFSLIAITFLIISLHFYAKRLRRRQRRRRHQDLIHRIRSQIAPTDLSFSESSNSGIDPVIMASLPKLLYKQTEQFNHGEITECSVCLGTIVEDAAIRVLPNCKHMFHADCVDTWFGSNSTCPVCRTPVEPRVQPGHDGHLAIQFQVPPTAPPVQDGGVQQDDGESETMGCSGLRIGSFHRMGISISRERSLKRDQIPDGSVIQDLEGQ